MITKFYKIILFTLLIFTSISCKTTKILPDSPALGNLPTAPEKASSMIELPMSLDITNIERLINDKLPKGKISEDSKKEGDAISYQYEVYRNKPVKLSTVGNELVFKIPIDLKIKGSYTACLGFWKDGDCCSSPKVNEQGCLTPGVTTTESGTTNPTIDVELRVKLNINEDYTLKADTYLKGILSGDTDLHFDLLGSLIKTKINIKNKLEKPLQDFMLKYESEINKKLNQQLTSLHLKENVTKFWNQLQEPVAISDLWLVTNPEQVLFENIKTKNNQLIVTIGLVSKISLETNKPNINLKPLPSLKYFQNNQGNFTLNIPLISTFDYLDQKLNQELKGKTIEKNGVKLTFNHLSIKGAKLDSVSTIQIKANVNGKAKFKKFKGDLYFTGIPSIDDTQKLVYFNDFFIDANTNSFLVNHKLPALANKEYYEKIKETFKYSYQKDYDKYINLINQKINYLNFENFVVQGNLQTLSIPGIFINSNQIELLLIAKGKLQTQINTNLSRYNLFKN